MSYHRLVCLHNSLLSRSLSPSDISHLGEVFADVADVAPKWGDVSLRLGLQKSRVETIETDHPGDSSACLREALTDWLRRNYDTQRFGVPLLRKLVEAVASKTGGRNPKLAEDLTEKYAQSSLQTKGLQTYL